MVRAEVGTHFSTWLREAALALGDEVLLPVTTNHTRAIAATSTELAVLARSTEGVGVTLLHYAEDGLEPCIDEYIESRQIDAVRSPSAARRGPRVGQLDARRRPRRPRSRRPAVSRRRPDRDSAHRLVSASGDDASRRFGWQSVAGPGAAAPLRRGSIPLAAR